MRSVLRVLLLSLLALTAFADSIIRDVSVVDVVSGRIEPHRDIVIRGSRIAAVRPAAIREKETRYAIPGLWDMHVHLWFPHSQFPLYIANGVTGVRDMGSDLKRVRASQAEIARGTIEGPRIYACGSPLSKTASDDANLPVDVVENPAQPRAAFLRDYEAHVDFVKVPDISDRSFEALAEMSRHDGLRFAGHLPLSVPAALAAQDRMVSMEHLFGMGLACSARQSELRNRALTGEAVTSDVIGSFDEHAAEALWDLFRRYDVRQTPTLDLWARMSGEDAGQSAPEVRYIERSVRERWKAPESLTTNAQYDFAFQLTREMAKAGLTPAQALRSATIEPARLMHRERELGEVRAGFDADLVILTGDLLADIGNTRRIDSVVSRGRVLDRTTLNRMLERTAAESARQ